MIALNACHGGPERLLFSGHGITEQASAQVLPVAYLFGVSITHVGV